MREMLKLVLSTICGAIKDVIESRSRWQKPSQEQGFLILWSRSNDLEGSLGECLVPRPPPLGYMLYMRMNNCKRHVGSRESQVSIRLGLEEESIFVTYCRGSIWYRENIDEGKRNSERLYRKEKGQRKMGMSAEAREAYISASN